MLPAQNNFVPLNSPFKFVTAYEVDITESNIEQELIRLSSNLGLKDGTVLNYVNKYSCNEATVVINVE